MIGEILNTIQLEGVSRDNIETLLFLVFLFFLIDVGFWAFHGPARVIETKNAFLVRANYKRYLVEGAMDLPIEWHTNHHSGDTIDKIEKGTNALYNFSSGTFEIIQGVVLLVGSFLALIYFSPISAAIIFFLSVITFLVIVRFDRTLIPQYQELNRAENKVSERVYDAVSNITTVVVLRIEKLLSAKIVKQMFSPLSLFIKNSAVNETKWFVSSLFGGVAIVSVLLVYVLEALYFESVMLVGSIYILYGYVQRVRDSFFRFAYLYGDVVQRRAAVMNAEEISKEFKNRLKYSQVNLKKPWKELVVKDLSFSYHSEEGADLHLDSISLNFHPKERIAVIGGSGSGKSTFLKLMRDLYHPSELTLMLDGKKIKGGFKAIRDNITLIPQEPEIFTTTIRENITLGLEYDESDLKKYLDMACFRTVVDRLPKGLESSLVEKGVNLSGGEKQRLALTRGLLACKEKSIVLLDEPTSSVDFPTELQIYQNIFSAFTEKVIISSVHRLHLLPLFDTIYYFANGVVIAKGNHEQLLRDSNEYKELWDNYVRSRDVVL